MTSTSERGMVSVGRGWATKGRCATLSHTALSRWQQEP